MGFYFCSVWVSLLSHFLCHLVSLPSCMGLFVVRFSVIWCHFRPVWVSMLSEFLCHLVSHPSCASLFAVRVSMSLGLTSVLYGSLCCQSFYVIWSHFRPVWVSLLSDFLCHLVSLPYCVGLYVC